MRVAEVLPLRRRVAQPAPTLDGRRLRIVSSPKPGPDASRVAGRTALTRFTRAVTVLALLTLGFAVFQTRVGNLSERRAQRELKSSLKQVLASGSGIGRDATGNPRPIPLGSPVAFLDIPRLGVNKVVVDGTGAEQLKRGPGLLVSSSLLGQPGHSIVVGRRTTYGSPFRQLHLLEAGDRITTITPFGIFEYSVRDVGTVEPRRVMNLEGSDGGLLSLVTSDPPYVGGRALAVTATLDGSPSTHPDPPRIATSEAGTIDFGGNPASRVGALVSGALLMVALIGADAMYQRWRRWTTYLLTTPVILALAFAWMQNLSSVLPASL